MTSQTHQRTIVFIDISRPISILLRFGPIFLYAWFVLQRAWLGDDIYITLRTVDNFVNGHGLVFNLGERVQSYTHPLWMLILSAGYAITHEAYFTTLVISLVISLLAALLLQFKAAENRWSGGISVVFLALSSAYLDYSSGGLENPLSHILLVIFAIVYFSTHNQRNRVFWLTFLVSLAFVNRQDVILLYLPILLSVVWRTPKKGIVLQLLLGALPAIAWEVFSVIYYGFPFPNTAYAKLNTAIPRIELWGQGIKYYLHTWDYDPCTLVMLIMGGILAATRAIKSQQRVWLIGILLYLAYIITIGGDFMGGRFLCLPLLAVAILIARLPSGTLSPPSWMIVLCVMGCLASLASSQPWDGRRFSKPDFDVYEVADERQYYFIDNGLFATPEWKNLPRYHWRQEGLDLARSEIKVVDMPLSGIRSYYAGPQVYIIDQYALSDAFLARQKFVPGDHWRIGHFSRGIPREYRSIKMGNEVSFSDPELQLLYDRITLVISGPLWSADRWQAIWELNRPAWWK